MSQPTSGTSMQGTTVPVRRMPSASGIIGTSSAAILAAAGPSHFDTSIRGGRERKGSDASESSGSSSRIRTRRSTRGISANLSNSDDNDSDASPNIPRKSSQTQRTPNLMLPGRETSSPPTDRPLIRQAVAFTSVQPAVTNISTYEASPAVPQSKKKPVFLPGQAPAGTGKKPRGKRGASSAVEAREALQAQKNGEASGQPGPTTTDGTTATGRSRKQGAYPGQTMRFRVSELSADTTPKPLRQRKNAAGTAVGSVMATTSVKAKPSSGLIDMPLKPGKGKERDTGIMNGGLGRMKLRMGQQPTHDSSAAPAPNDMDDHYSVGDAPSDIRRRMGVDREVATYHPRSYSGSSTGHIISNSGSTSHTTSHKPAGSYYRRNYDNGTEILDLTEQRDSETPPPPLLLPTSSTASLPSDILSSNDKPSRFRTSQSNSRHSTNGHPLQSKPAANDSRLPPPTSFYSLDASSRTDSYPPAESECYDIQTPASPPRKMHHISGGKFLQAQMALSPSSSPNQDSPELEKRGKPRTVTIYICDFRTGQLDEQLVELKVSLVPCSSPQEGYWTDANDLCKSIQSSPSRIDGPAKAFTMRGTARQFILRVSHDNVDEFMHAKVLVQKDRSLRLTVELLQPVGSLPLPPPPRPHSPYDNRYESYHRHSDRMDVDPRLYDRGPSPRPRYYHRKRPSSPSFDNYDGYSNQPSFSRYSSNKAPRNGYDWDMTPRHPHSEHYDPRSPSPRHGERGDQMDVEHSLSRKRPGPQHRHSSRESNHRLDIYSPRNQSSHRQSSRQFLGHRSHTTPSRDLSLEPEFPHGHSVNAKRNPNERRQGHFSPEPLVGLRRSRSASSIESSDGGSSLDEVDPFMGSVMKVLRLDQKLWDDFYSESTCSLPPVQHLIKKYDILQKLLQKYATTKVPGYEVVMEEKYILQIMWNGFRSKRGRARLMEELKEAVGLIGYYGPNGTRVEMPEVVRIVSEGDPAITFEELALVRKGLLSKLRRVHQEWEKRQVDLRPLREHQRLEDQVLDRLQTASSQSIVPQVVGVTTGDPSGSAAAPTVPDSARP